MNNPLNDICEVLQQAHRLGWISSRDGNVSYKQPGSSDFWITPSGVIKHRLTAEHLIRLAFEGSRLVRQEASPHSASLQPTGELSLHRQLMQNFHGERCVLHLHPTYTVAALYAGFDLLALAEDFPEINRYTRVGPSVGVVPPISEELAAHTVQRLGLSERGEVQSDIVALDRHGVVSVADTPWAAFEHVERLEHVCKIALVAGTRA